MTLGHDVRQVRAGLSFWQRRKLEFAVGLFALALVPLGLALVPALAGLYLLPGAAVQRLKTTLSGKLMDRAMGGMMGGMGDTISTAVPGDPENVGPALGDVTPDVDMSLDSTDDFDPVEEGDAVHNEGFASHMSDRNTPDENE